MVKYLIMDVDGTLTDGKIYIGSDGELFKAFNVKDGLGICEIAIPRGVVPVIITGRSSKIISKRCLELGITQVFEGAKNKLDVLLKITDELSDVAYIGDDINDLSCMERIKNEGGLTGCPANANDKILNVSSFVSKYNGGEGAVRDFIEWFCDCDYKL